MTEQRATSDQVELLLRHVDAQIAEAGGDVVVDKFLLRAILLEVQNARIESRSNAKRMLEIATTLRVAGVLVVGESFETGYERLAKRYEEAASGRLSAQTALAVARRELRAALRSRDLHAMALLAIRSTLRLLDRKRGRE